MEIRSFLQHYPILEGTGVAKSREQQHSCTERDTGKEKHLWHRFPRTCYKHGRGMSSGILGPTVISNL